MLLTVGLFADFSSHHFFQVLIAFEITITLYKEGRAYFRERKQAREGAVAQ